MLQATAGQREPSPGQRRGGLGPSRVDVTDPYRRVTSRRQFSHHATTARQPQPAAPLPAIATAAAATAIATALAAAAFASGAIAASITTALTATAFTARSVDGGRCRRWAGSDQDARAGSKRARTERKHPRAVGRQCSSW